MENQGRQTLQIGETKFFVAHLKTWNKEKFIATYSGLVTWDIDDGWRQVQARLKELGLTTKVEEKQKRKFGTNSRLRH